MTDASALELWNLIRVVKNGLGQPNSDLQLISRILSVDGTKRRISPKGCSIIARITIVCEMPGITCKNFTNVTLPYSFHVDGDCLAVVAIARRPTWGCTLQFPEWNRISPEVGWRRGNIFALRTGTDLEEKTITNKSVLVSLCCITVRRFCSFLIFLLKLSMMDTFFYKGNSFWIYLQRSIGKLRGGLDKGGEIPAWYCHRAIASDWITLEIKCGLAFTRRMKW